MAHRNEAEEAYMKRSVRSLSPWIKAQLTLTLMLTPRALWLSTSSQFDGNVV
jgi:hypothetical protein